LRNRRWRRRRWRWRRRQINEDSTYNATNHATGNPSLNPTGDSFITAGIDVRFLDDFSRSFNRGSPWTYGRHSLNLLRLRR
jgi:hypothetical protein